MNNKNGVSAVVATVLIIMITVAAVGIIWAAIIPMVRNSLDKGTACFDAQSDVSLVTDGGYTCINRNSNCTNGSVANILCGNISLQIKKASNTKVELVAVQALVFIGGDSITYRINKSSTSILNSTKYTNATVGIVGVLPSNNEFKIANIWDVAVTNATKVKLAPIVTVGKTEEICEATTEVTLPNCA